MANEVLQEDILRVSTSTIGFDHQHLVGMDGVHISISHVRDCHTRAQRTECRSSTPVTVDVLNENVCGRTLTMMLAQYNLDINQGPYLNRYALVFVCYHNLLMSVN